jgi:hypothetical protein
MFAETIMDSDINLKITRDEALVLFEFFARFSERDEFTLRNTAEYLSFQTIAAQLDRELVEPFDPAYEDLLVAARNRLSSGYEGPAPGVVYE